MYCQTVKWASATKDKEWVMWYLTMFLFWITAGSSSENKVKC